MVVCMIDGDVGSAVLCNPYILFVSPYIILLFVVELFPKYVSAKVKNAALNPVLTSLIAVLMLFWWVFCNTDMWQSIVMQYS